jgi:choline dehydrogenase-like flavoprotein
MMDDATRLAQGAEVSADICIIGSGAAGITLALKLVGTGKKILLLESAAQNRPVRVAEEDRACPAGLWHISAGIKRPARPPLL